MAPFLVAIFAAFAAIFLTLIEPIPRHVLALKCGLLLAALAGAGAALWPEPAAAMGIGLLVCLLLWMAGRVLLWPLHFIGEILRGE